jgi:hypothetical protein
VSALVAGRAVWTTSTGVHEMGSRKRSGAGGSAEPTHDFDVVTTKCITSTMKRMEAKRNGTATVKSWLGKREGNTVDD